MEDYGSGQVRMYKSPAGGKTPKTGGGKRKGKNKKGVKKWVVVLVSVIAVLGILAGTVYGIYRHYFGMLGSIDSNAGGGDIGSDGDNDPNADPATDAELSEIEKQMMKNLRKMEANSDLYKTDTFNILLVGVDSRGKSMSGRSDSMILVSIDKKNKKVTMTSFLRDIYVSIPGHGNNRLNAAYAFGGADLLTETIKVNFGISVDRCVVVNFYFVMNLVDAVGGIDLDVSAAEIEVMNMYIAGHNDMLGNPKGTDILSASDAGTIHANGNQALGYARVRYVGTDFARTGRQRTIITKCIEKIKDMSLKQISDFAEEFLPQVQTDLTQSDCAALLVMAVNLKDYETKTLAVPIDGTWQSKSINRMSVLIIDFEANSEAWRNLVNGSEKE